MATCKWCGKSGLFLKLTPKGLCATCAPGIALEASSIVRVMNESLILAAESYNTEIVIERLQLAREKAKSLLKYEQKGIILCTPRPSEYLQNIDKQNDDIIIAALERELTKILDRNAEKKPKTQLSYLSTFEQKVQEARNYFDAPDRVTPILERVQLLQIKLQELI